MSLKATAYLNLHIMQKYAFLITAHTDAKQLLRLMKRLLSLGDIFLMIDKKQKDKAFLDEIENFATTWGGVK